MKKYILIVSVICLVFADNIKCQYQWVSQNSGTSAVLTSVYFTSKDTGYVCSENGFVFKTVNGGQKWNMLGPGPSGSLFFLDNQNGFGAGAGCILKTVNGGATWDTSFSNPEIFEVTSIYFPNHNYGYGTAMLSSIGSFILKTTKGMITWDTVYYPSDIFNTIFFTDSLIGYIGGWQGYIYKTTNGGSSWLPIPIDTVNQIIFNSIFFPTPDTGYAAYGSFSINGIYKTIDGGNTWINLSYPFPSPLHSVFFTDANHGCAVGGDGMNSMSLYQTNNGGNTWFQGASGVQTMNSVFFLDSLTGYTVGSNGTILKYTLAVGISDNSMAEINIYPNPAYERITVEFSDRNILHKTQISIYSIQGQIMLQQELYQKITSLDISQFASGVYILKIIGEDTNKSFRILKE